MHSNQLDQHISSCALKTFRKCYDIHNANIGFFDVFVVFRVSVRYTASYNTTQHNTTHDKKQYNISTHTFDIQDCGSLFMTRTVQMSLLRIYERPHRKWNDVFLVFLAELFFS